MAEGTRYIIANELPALPGLKFDWDSAHALGCMLETKILVTAQPKNLTEMLLADDELRYGLHLLECADEVEVSDG